MPRFLDYSERLFLILIYAPFLIEFATFFPIHPWWMLLAVSEALAVGLILIRRPGEMVTTPYAFGIAFAGSALPLFIRPVEGSALVPVVVSTGLMFIGLAFNISAKLFLNRSFGVVAANRGVKRGGPYRLVRHPMYLGYITTQFGFLLASFSVVNLGLYLAAWTLQVLRIREEEKFLLLDPAYRDYSARVRFRLIPGVV